MLQPESVHAASASHRKRPTDEDEPGAENKHLRGMYLYELAISSLQPRLTGPSTIKKRGLSPKENTGLQTASKMVKQTELVDRNTQLDFEQWKAAMRPVLLQRTIYAPPVHMNRELLQRVLFADKDVYITQPPVMTQNSAKHSVLQDSIVRDDDAQRHFLYCLRELTDKLSEVMVVVSQLRFEDYLKEPSYRASIVKFPKPVDTKHRRGVFDFLIIHPVHGLLIIEIKAIGDRFESSWPEAKKDAQVSKKVELAVKQLNKVKAVLTHLISDKKPAPPVKTALVMPNIGKDQLERVLITEHKLKKDLCKCLNIEDSEDPLGLCLYADRMSAKDRPWDVTVDVMNALTSWWQQVFAEDKSGQCLEDDDYLDLVARFCGPATYASSFSALNEDSTPHYLLTLGQAVSQIGDRFSRCTLRRSQLDVLEEALPLRFLCGPPGTGKTVVLMLIACKWLLEKEERDLHIVSTWSGSLAASHLIVCKLKQLCPGCENRIRLHEFDLNAKGQAKEAVEIMLDSMRDGELFVICDEAFGGSEFSDLCTQLNNCKKLHLWAASVYHSLCPPCLQKQVFTEPLRTPPVVTREVKRSGVITAGLVPSYCACSTPLPCEGPPPIMIQHEAQGHSTGWPGDCEECGNDLATELLKLIADSRLTTAMYPSCGAADATPNSATSGGASTEATPKGPKPLCFNDVFILTTYYELIDEKRDDDDNIVTQASGLLKGLKQAGVPYRVVVKGDSAALAEVVAMSDSDAVIVAEADTIRGLERKVVVWVQSEMGDTSGDIDFARLDAWSRTTAQLVKVKSGKANRKTSTSQQIQN
ncbi:hypothetical protein BaRGS_00031390 [Batillaria attramentaria]|uniref:NERD domain-containing protein n=1 Tax=Batillaria attramentaria TaxID=370345 RepID=A0ABD0JR56_9CAEN